MSFLTPNEGLVRAAFRVTLERVQPIAAMGLLDEESLTASLLGGVATTAPLLEELAMWEASSAEAQSESKPVGSLEAGLEDQVVQSGPSASWGTYNKSGGAGDPTSETATGGDFALVIWDGPECARIAVFQAKKGTVYKYGSKWTLNVRRGPTESSEGFTQFVMLFANAIRCSQARINQPSLSIAKSFKQFSLESLKKSIEEVSWVHYLAYMEGTFACVPLAACSAALKNELAPQKTSHTIEISIDSPRFYDVLTAGFDGDKKMWLPITRSNLEALLPSLLHLMPVHVVDEKGAGGLILGTVQGTAFFVSRKSGSQHSLKTPK
ncbi:hypothetical protein [Stenotrophomonas sp. C1657]|uniref:hypothetical protein n=1 Tax=Stenotrophomonas sp. C1657 TaxID=3077844 RepID=UPI00293C7C5F|nr:hypothetical protein [Stenotrophomonas sp. C1657]MDV3514682.1 hypothetical protein [Stenotrophomonas sp. C1657]